MHGGFSIAHFYKACYNEMILHKENHHGRESSSVRLRKGWH